MRVGELRFEPDRRAEFRDRFLQFAASLQKGAEAVVGVGVFGIDPNCATISSDRFHRLPLDP